ncbi:MAG: hypothetical protein ABEJ81_02580 [Haloferacaceae archaeon]
MASDRVIATLVALTVTASFPFYLHGARIVLTVERVTWDVLVRHLKVIAVGLTLTTVPMVTWMMPRLLAQLSGPAALHAVLGLQAYAMLVFALTGIVRIFQAKRAADLYCDPNPDVDLNDLHENMGAWRGRLRIGVFGYVVFWFLAWSLGVYRYLVRYVL